MTTRVGPRGVGSKTGAGGLTRGPKPERGDYIESETVNYQKVLVFDLVGLRKAPKGKGSWSMLGQKKPRVKHFVWFTNWDLHRFVLVLLVTHPVHGRTSP